MHNANNTKRKNVTRVEPIFTTPLASLRIACLFTFCNRACRGSWEKWCENASATKGCSNLTAFLGGKKEHEILKRATFCLQCRCCLSVKEKKEKDNHMLSLSKPTIQTLLSVRQADRGCLCRQWDPETTCSWCLI